MEEWRSVVGFCEYEVSNLGRVKRVAGGMRGARAGRILKPTSHNGFYPLVGLWRNNERKEVTVHSLVAEAFIGARPDGHEVNHIDANKQNPRVENLEYVTRKRNAEHARELGLVTALCGEAAPSARLTEHQVIAIRNDAASMSYLKIAEKYGIDNAHVSRICRGLLWGSVGGPLWEKRRIGNNQHYSRPASALVNGSKA